MASARKKLDEKHQKILRELVSLPSNKHCFDCHQRGPTYVNVTIGSFVCTTCSGILRGLTPPHRVKSISMATFTPDEVDLVRARGNEYCKRVWLGLCDSDQPTKDEQQIKDFMIAKYEKKRYYIEPAEEPKAVSNGGFSGHNGRNKESSESPQISRPTPSKNPPPINLHQIERVSSTARNKVNINNNSVVVSEGFANFDNNPIFTASPQPFAGWDCSWEFCPQSVPSHPAPQQQAPPLHSLSSLLENTAFSSPWETTTSRPSSNPPSNRWSYGGAPPVEDRYAALKDLDCLMKTQLATEQASSASDWGNGFWTPRGVDNAVKPPQPSLTEPTVAAVNSSNPFAGENGWADTNNFIGNPFKAARAPNSDLNWAVSGGLTNGFPTSQSLNFGSAKLPWNSEPVSANPFSLNQQFVGWRNEDKGHHSSNPFL